MKKKRIVIFALAAFLLLTGLSAYVVKIRTKNGEPLIDLDELLLSEEIGNPGSDDSGDEAEASESAPEASEEAESTAADVPTVKPKQEVLRISVYSNAIFMDGKLFGRYDREAEALPGIDTVKERIRSSKKIELVDNYAEAHAFRYMQKIVRALKKAADIEEIMQEAAE